jgi:hypothetical protein
LLHGRLLKILSKITPSKSYHFRVRQLYINLTVFLAYLCNKYDFFAFSKKYLVKAAQMKMMRKVVQNLAQLIQTKIPMKVAKVGCLTLVLLPRLFSGMQPYSADK